MKKTNEGNIIKNPKEHKKEVLRRYIENVLNHKKLLESQKQTMREYKQTYKLREKVNSLQSIMSVLNLIKKLGITVKKDFKDITKE
ncbi:hypothetical protein JXC34_01755, partial [Candidatus Woesearchaeota archaeon]|nr:hypothetical protein [Candidatus Woesearchaeota archaeon]